MKFIIQRELNGGTRTYLPSFYENNCLTINHNSGPFSCSTIALQDIMIFYNDFRKLPENVDRHKQYGTCKIITDDENEDISSAIYNTKITDNFYYDRERLIINLPKIDSNSKVEGTYPAHGIYKDILFEDINPFINKYFSPSELVVSNVQKLEIKYNISYKKTCYILYRGQDKSKEMPISPYSFFIEKALSVAGEDAFFLVQTDEIEFLDECKVKLKNVIYIEDCVILPVDAKTPLIEKVNPSFKLNHLINYFSSILIGSKCEYLITHTGNGGFWTSVYRGNSKNVYQAICGNSKNCGDIYHTKNCFNIWIDSEK